MFDSEVDQKIQTVLKTQAKYTTFEILSMLVQSDHPPISTDQLKALVDRIYTCLYSFHYADQSPQAEAFLRRHLDQMQYADWEPELIEGVGE